MLKIKEDQNLKDFSGLRVGFGTGTICEVESKKDFEGLLKTVSKEELEKMLVIGDGTNTVFVNEVGNLNLLKINIKEIATTPSKFLRNFATPPLNGGDSDPQLVSVGAGVNWDYFVQEYIKLGGVGMERLSMIPGTVGAAPVQNIGAYGAEVSEFIHSVYTYDKQTNEFKLLLNHPERQAAELECEFAYRDSIFKKQKNRFIILSVNFEIKKGEVKIPEYKDIQNALFNKDKIKEVSDFWTLKLPENLEELMRRKYKVQEIREAIILVRANKLPDPSVIPNCGSFFKNPIIDAVNLVKLKNKFPEIPIFPQPSTKLRAGVKIPLAYILEKIGLKGYNSDFKNGNFGIYKNHSLVVVSNGAGNVSEFKKFINFVKKRVLEESGLVIDEEVNLI